MSQPAPPSGAAGLLERFRYPLYGLLAVAILSGIGVLLWRQPEPTAITIIPPEPTPIPSPTATPGPYTVYVTGAVARPESTVLVPAGSRVQDAIDGAGGAAPEADLDGVNLAQLLRDGDMVYVPPLQLARATTPTPNRPPVVHVNSATLEELQALPGVGPALAQAIVDYRTEHGAYPDLESLDAVPGIGPSKLEAMREFVVFD